MALTKTGAALKGYGNSYGETIGLITAGTEMLPNQASKVARGWRTIGANVLKLAQDEEVLQAANGKVNISLRDSQGNMKSTFDILKDLHKGVEGQSVAWKDLSQEEQSSISLMLAGKTQTEVFKSTMDNFTQAIKANETAQNSQGSAARENARYLDSIQGHLASFQTAWEQLSYHIVNSDMIKAFIDLGTNAVKAFDKIWAVFDSLPGKYSGVVGLLTSIASIIAAFKFNKILELASDFGKLFSASKEVASGVEAVGSAAGSAASGGVSKLVSGLALLTNPVVLGGLGALAVAIAAIEIDKYFSFEGATKRLQEYQDKLAQVSDEISALEEKRSSNEGLTDDEKLHLDVLKAEERSLERQIELEKERAKAAFKKDATSSAGKAFQERTGPKELLSYNDSLSKQREQYEKIAKLKETIAGFEDKEKKFTLTPEDMKLWEEADKQLKSAELEWAEIKSATADAGVELSQYWANVKDSVPYEELDSKQKKVYDDLHRAHMQNQIDINGIKDNYLDMSSAIENITGAFTGETLNLFDDIDIGSLKTVEDVVDAFSNKIKSLDDEQEITLAARDETGNIIDEIKAKKSDLTDKEWEMVVNATTTGEYDKLQEYIDSGDSEHKDILMEFIPEGEEEVESKKEDLEEPGETEVKVSAEGFEEFKREKEAAEQPWKSEGIVTDGGSIAGLKQRLDSTVDQERTADVDVTDNGQSNQLGGKISSMANTKRTARVGVTDNGQSNQVGGKIRSVADAKYSATVKVGETGASSVQSTINGIRGKSVNISIFKTIYEKIKHSATGKRKGEKGGMSWLGDEGTKQNPKPELVVGEDGAYLAGTNGWEMRYLKSSDTVYTHAQTKKLLGNQNFDNIDSVELPRYAKGKKSKKKSKKKSARDKYDSAKKAYDKAKKAYNKAKKGNDKKKKKKALDKAKKAFEKAKKALEKKRSTFDSDLETLEYKREVNDWTEDKFKTEYDKLVKKYGNNLSTKQKRAYNEAKDEIADKKAQENSERWVGLVGVGGMTSAKAVSNINSRKHLTADEKKEYRAQAYKASVEYNLKEYENGKDTRKKIVADIKNYYKQRGVYDEEYYKMLDDLREADKERELKRLKELQEKEENKFSYLEKYAKKQVDYYDEQVDKEKEEAEELEKLAELQEKLNDAKKTMIRVYREGVGFVYEQDAKAVREAQKALDDYNKSKEKSEAERMKEEWQSVVDLFDKLEEASDMKEIELKLGIGGITDLTGGDIGTDIAEWTKVIKDILIQSNALADVIGVLDNASGADIDKLLGQVLTGGNHTISDSTLSEYIKNHSFASGTLNSPAGLSIVGENGAELAWLNKGSAVFPNSISKNLMEWGKYNPMQVLDNTSDSTKNQIFNFDKIVLPNVHNADDFYKELQSLPNRAIQQSALRA